MTNINQQQLDRLVDGELSDTERRELLELIERNSDGWRQCACAFLEAQEFGDALTCVVAPNPQSPADLAANSGATSKEETTQIPNDCEHRYEGANSLRWWAALAACLAIGVAIGQMSTGRVDSPASNVAFESDGSLPTDTNQMIAADTASNSSLANPSLHQQYSVVPNDIEDILGRLGQRVERRQVYMPAGASDPMVLPVEEIEIVPVRWDTY